MESSRERPEPGAAGAPAEADRQAEFEVACPGFADTRALDELRRDELSRLDREGHVYLDYTGGGLYPDSLVRRHAELLLGSVFGNPHSSNPTSSAATDLVESTRSRVLEYFRADPQEYVVVFTSNASHALKLVGESYPFEAGDRFLLTFDNHNSVNGIREFDRAHGARTTYVPLTASMRVDEAVLDRELAAADPERHNLFAYPAQSNFSGVQHPLEWVERARERGWDVLLDAAAFVPTNRLDLSRCHPDYVAVSFYKMFGYPTGVGVLLGRHQALAQLHRPWFAGGTIEVASVQADRYVLARGAAAFEDGTLSYLDIPAVSYGLDLMEEIGVERIQLRVACLTRWLLGRLRELRHAGGTRLVRVYGPDGANGGGRPRGGTVAFNLYDASGARIDHQRVERRAAERRISLRTGCFCNPGAGESALGLSKPELEGCFGLSEDGLTYEEFRGCVDPEKGAGAVRVSLGLASNLADVEAFVRFLAEFLD